MAKKTGRKVRVVFPKDEKDQEEFRKAIERGEMAYGGERPSAEQLKKAEGSSTRGTSRPRRSKRVATDQAYVVDKDGNKSNWLLHEMLTDVPDNPALLKPLYDYLKRLGTEEELARRMSGYNGKEEAG